jgi:hypothetical protein
MRHKGKKDFSRKISLLQGVEVSPTHCESEKCGRIQSNRSCATIRNSQTQLLAKDFAVVESGLKIFIVRIHNCERLVHDAIHAPAQAFPPKRPLAARQNSHFLTYMDSVRNM